MSVTGVFVGTVLIKEGIRLHAKTNRKGYVQA